MTAAAAIIIRKEKELVAHFVSRGATSADTAQTRESLGVEENFIFRQLQAHGVVRESRPGGGLWWLDQGTWDALQLRRRRTARIVLVIALVLGALALLYTLKQG